MRGKLYEPKPAVEFGGEVRCLVVHGLAVEPSIWRFGEHVPNVTLPALRLVVTGKLKEHLAWPGAEFVRVASLVHTVHRDDWTKWTARDWMRHGLRLKRESDADEWEEIIMPVVDLSSEYFRTGDPQEIAAKVLAGRRVIINPDLWWVRARNVVPDAKRVGKGLRTAAVPWGDGVYQMRGLFSGRLLLDEDAKDALVTFSVSDSIEFVEHQVE